MNSAKAHKSRGLGLLLCCVHDGRKKICGRDVSQGLEPLTLADDSDPDSDLVPLNPGAGGNVYFVLSSCPKHGEVICNAPGANAAMLDARKEVYFPRAERMLSQVRRRCERPIVPSSVTAIP